jgi:hypothetical protein
VPRGALDGALRQGGLDGRLEAGWRQAGGRLEAVEAGWRQAGCRLEAGWRQAGGRLEASWGQDGARYRCLGNIFDDAVIHGILLWRSWRPRRCHALEQPSQGPESSYWYIYASKIDNFHYNYRCFGVLRRGTLCPGGPWLNLRRGTLCPGGP